MWPSVKMLRLNKGQWSGACGLEKFQEVSPQMSIVTDAPKDCIEPLSTLCPGNLDFELHIEGCELDCELGLEV